MVAAIAWLIETILATLLIGKLDAWIRRVGLADDIEKLKSEIRRIRIVLSTVKERGIRNELMAESLALLEDYLYDADNVVDELDYYRLQQDVQGVTMDEPEGMPEAERVDEMSTSDANPPMNSSVGKLRSVVWEHFTITEKDNGKPVKAKCTYCTEEFKCETKTNGTSSMKKHLEKEHSVCTNKPPGAPPNHSSSSRRKGKKRRSKAWDLFDIIEEENEEPIKAICKYCPTEIKCGAKYGTAGMLNHNKICKEKPGPDDQPPNPSSTGDVSAIVTPTAISDPSNRKRRIDDEESAQITAANMRISWDKTILLSNMIKKITSQLQDARGQVSEVLKLHGSDYASSSNLHHSKGLDQHLRTSSFAPRKVYGRVAEKNSIIKMITEDKSDGVAVLPIVGIAGVGKTVLAQLVYNDLDMEKQFHHRIWVWVSRNFDEVRLTTEMINFVSRERHEGSAHKNGRHDGIKSFVKLQQILKEHMEYQPRKFLLVLDDVWDNFDDYRWKQLLAPLISSDVKGNVILVTTRNFSVAQKIGTLKPVKLGSLANDLFWLLFESHAFGDKNCARHQSLSIVGRKIAEKLRGNPLAAETAGELLRKHLSVDHWNNIMRNEDWKSLQLSRGIMPALKLSYDQLPYHLQQCLSCSSIFPESYQFLGQELIQIWISQGFVKCNHSIKRLEEIGQTYMTDLVNLGFFKRVEEQEEEEESSPGSQTCYSMCGLMHDFARMVSSTESTIIDGLQCKKMSLTIRHLSVVTDSSYRKDQYGNIPRNKKFEENLRNAITSVRKLRTLVLLGHYDSFFFQLFQDIFQTAGNLRMVQMCAASTAFNSFICLANPVHLRYLKRESDGFSVILPQVLTKFLHLQVLDIGSNTNADVAAGFNNLVSLRHLVAHKGVCSSIASIGKMTSLQGLHDFQVQMSSGFEVTQLQVMNKLVQLGVSQLDNVKTGEEAYGARLRGKIHLEKLDLSWKDTLLDEEPSTDTAREVLEGLEPHMDLKHLQISGYGGANPPTWLASNISVTCLQTLHLHNCGELQILPSLENLPFLTKLNLSSMREVTEVLVPSLEEIVLIKMPKLVRCSSTCVEGLSSSLRILQIEECHALKEFDLFESHDKFEIEQRSWLPGLRKLILRQCPHMEVSNPLPPSTICSELLITRVSKLPSMKGSSSEKLRIGYFDEEKFGDGIIDESSDELRILNDKTLAFHNLRNLKSMRIMGCQKLSSFSLEGFSHLLSLKSLEISMCRQLFSSDAIPDATREDETAANCEVFPSLQSLSIKSCGISRKWLSLLLRHAPDLEELHLHKILLIKDRDSSSGEQDDTLEGLARDGLVHILPLNLISSLKKITISKCRHLTFNWSKEGFSAFTSLQELHISERRMLFFSLVNKDRNDDRANGRWLLPTSLVELDIRECPQKTLQPCFPSDITSLKKLKVWGCPGLQSLQLHSCTALEELTVAISESLIALEGLQYLGSLRHLAVCRCPCLPRLLGRFSRQGYELCSRLETLQIDDPCVLTTSFCEHLTYLQRLLLQRHGLTEEEGRALVLLKSLQELKFNYCPDLVDLPAGLHTLPSLKRLEITLCEGISRLPETGLPLSLEELEIVDCRKELADQCRGLATSKLRVKIDGDWTRQICWG